MGAHTLTTSELASHIHYVTRNKDLNDANENEGYSGSHDTVGDYNNPAGWNRKTSSAGSSTSHTHSLTGSKSTSASSFPPYYALAYIMRCA